MADDIVDLDEYRCLTAQKMIDMRRRFLHEFRVEQKILSDRNDVLEELLNAGPAESWPLAAAKATYLIQLFATIPGEPDSKRNELISQTLSDLNRLSDVEDGR